MWRSKQIRALLLLVVAFLVMSGYANAKVYADAPGTVGTWSTAANSLPQVRQSQTTVTYGGYVYVVGGYDGSSVQDSIFTAPLNSDGSPGTWTTQVNVLPAALRNAIVVADTGYLYVVGGTGASGVQAKVYSAPISNGTVGVWSTSANDLPQAVSQSTGFVYNGYIYTVGGEDVTIHYISNVYSAPISGGTVGAWSTSNPSLPTGIALSTGGVYNGYAYIFGGNNNAPSATVYSAQLGAGGTIGSWTQSPNDLPQVRCWESSVIYNGYAFVFGGLGPGLQTKAEVFSAPLSSGGAVGAWTTQANVLPVTLAAQSAIVNNGFVNIIAGAHSGATASIYMAQLWGAPAAVVTPTGSGASTPTVPNTGYGPAQKSNSLLWGSIGFFFMITAVTVLHARRRVWKV